MLCSKIEDGFATVFRQVVLTRFEQALHKARREQGELSTEQINELWLAANRPMHGGVVQLSDGYGWWWMYIGHFIHAPFYVYAYAFGDCLVNSLYAVYEKAHEGFAERYLAMLAAGGTKHHSELLKPFGLDAREPAFWSGGLSLLWGIVIFFWPIAGELALAWWIGAYALIFGIFMLSLALRLRRRSRDLHLA